MSRSFAIQIRDLAKTFTLHNQGGTELAVLNAVSLDVHPGECVALDGPSGAGKSTLLKCIYGNYRATQGTLIVSDGNTTLDLTTASLRQQMAMRRTTVSYVSQFLRTIPRVSALDIVAEPLMEGAGGDIDRLAAARRTAETLLLRLRIPPRLWSVPPATFSGGEQQRINIARGLICPRPVLLLDEPTASLDAENRLTVTAMINEAREQGAAIVGIFHDQRVRDTVATRVINMAEFR
ncbi:MAG: phosphonate C-P lyase system protein PhnL [Betaproteobacteria bacterium]|jgi:alpha-D-ribose 1-methylphosphonate 5-triphosphate synthase subunit PhnL|nr:phosphonate ABC transporter ATPase [Betaproteobacteria bacterium UKL13-2]HCG53533.1 phosphonate C-P lyase system protein PhnL [Betaproteobacteria bacterium]